MFTNSRISRDELGAIMSNQTKWLEQSNLFRKTGAINDLIGVLTTAYSLGLPPTEVRAICGAVYGDWFEAHDLIERVGN